MARHIRVTTMGGFEIRLRDSAALRLQTRKAEALFAQLALSPVPIRRDVLCAMFWADVPDAQARHSLRQTLSKVRAGLANERLDILHSSGDAIHLDPRQLRVDVLLVEKMLNRPGTAWALRTACGLCRGDFLPGLDVRESAFDQWLTLQRARARQLSIEAHERYLDLLIQQEQAAAGIHVALRLVALDALHERAHRALMELYAMQGNLGASLRQYELCSTLLGRELGVAPSVETQELRRKLLAGRLLQH